MRSYKLKSYVPEENFLLGKDARFCRAAFEDAFVINASKGTVIASIEREHKIELSMSDVAALLTLFEGDKEFLTLSHSRGTLLVYPAWQHIGLCLGFLFRESAEEIEKALKNAQRYAFSTVFDDDNINQQLSLKFKLCVLQFYMEHLFGAKRETNATAQILMLANLLGCRLHEMSVSRVNVTLDEHELEKLSAFLACTFMTMRRYNGVVSTSDTSEENTEKTTHVVQEYGLRVQQSMRKPITKPTQYDVPTASDFASFATHPAFKNYQIEEENGSLCLHLPLHQKALLSSITSRTAQNEIVLTLFPLK